MNNNKQTMKLYTEEQVRKAVMIAENQKIGFTTIVIEHLTPIELPSQEEIKHLQWIYDRMSKVHSENENYDYMLKFKEIIEQLKKGGNK